MTARLGIDIGGTFTDFVLAADGVRHRHKCPSTPDDYARAIGDGLNAILREAGLRPDDLTEVLHGTTIASNAILEGKGARTGLITTRGFRDILEIRTLRMPRLYDLHWTKPPVLVERALRCEVVERMGADGLVQIALDEASVVAALRLLLAEQVQAIAVCLLHSYANDSHERRIGELAALHAPGIRVSLSVDVLPELREYERTSTTVINAYLQPVVGAYLDRLGALLRERGVMAKLLLMQSAGGLMPAEQAVLRPVGIVESGPAAGVVGAMALARASGVSNLISFDMGGTTAKAALVTDGEASLAAEFQVGGGIMGGSRLLTGGGYTLRVPAIDLAEVGAGGGSIVWLDQAGAPQVGPRSAGAVPGPVAYGQGGTEPTVTDCTVVLGWLGAALAGGTVSLHAASARAAVAVIAAALGVEVAAAAYGAVEVATATMIRAIRAVSSERGRDPRDFALVAFGGNGGMFAASVARSLGMRRVLIPPSPGLFSAAGLLEGVVEHQASRTFKTLLADADTASVERLLAGLAADVRRHLAEAGEVTLRRLARLRYHGQSFELTVAVDDAFDAAAAGEAFGAEHERSYGHRAGAEEPVELVSLAVLGRAQKLPLPLWEGARGEGCDALRVPCGPTPPPTPSHRGRGLSRHPTRVLRPGRLARHKAARARRSVRAAARRPAHHRGIRCHHRGAPRRNGRAGRGRQSGDQPVTEPPLLATSGLTKIFGRLTALRSQSITVRSGEVVGVIGPNGSGKSTFFNLVTGFLRPNAGEVRLDGVPIANMAPARIVRLGIARTFQGTRLFAGLSVLENVRAAAQLRHRSNMLDAVLGTPRVRAAEAQGNAFADELLGLVDLRRHQHRRAGDLPYGDQRRLELVRALATAPRLLMLDEPAAGMDAGETRVLLRLISDLRHRFKLGVIVVEHDMDLIMNLCDRIQVLAAGETVFEGSPAEVQAHPRVREVYLGA